MLSSYQFKVEHRVTSEIKSLKTVLATPIACLIALFAIRPPYSLF
jgi:hypothetical protein